MKTIIRGKLVCDVGLAEALEQSGVHIQGDLFSLEHNTERSINALDLLGELLVKDTDFLKDELMKYGLSERQAAQTKLEAREVLQRDGLLQKMKRELPKGIGSIQRISPSENVLEGYMPLGVLGHITSGNDAMLPFLSAVEGLITGNINVIKPAWGAGDIAIEMVQKLCEIDPGLCPYFYIFPISSKQEDLLSSMLSLCDGAAVWGGNGAIEGIQKLLSPGTRLIAWGHRISFAYFTLDGVNDAALEGLSKDICINNQQACSAPQVVYLETQSKGELDDFAQKLFDSLKRISKQYPLPAISKNDTAELTSATLLEEMGELMGDKHVLVADDYSFRIFVSYKSDLAASPLYRTILVRPISRETMLDTLRPYRASLQSAALSCQRKDIAYLAKLLFKCGVSRVVDCGSMAEGYAGEPHDGVSALMQYVKCISLENKQFPVGMSRLSEMETSFCIPFKSRIPVLKKQDFHPEDFIGKSGYLVLKSGGSSGKTVYAPHTYEDTQRTYVTTASGLLSAGLDPDADICMNLMYAGDLYGGFISIYEAIKITNATQLPMCASMEFEKVCNEIMQNKVNTLIGMPTYLIRLLSEHKDILKGRITKIFYAGEHFDPKMAEKLKADLGIKIIKSFVYGSNELGSIGYTCPYCNGTEHHLFGDTKYIEILKFDCDEPVSPGEIGRIVISSTDENLPILRYEIGDLGRMITEPCPCGRLAPKFELLGRSGNVFKFATNYVNFEEIKSILEKHLGYIGKLQIVLAYDNTSLMTVKVEKSTDKQKVLSVLRQNYPEIEECLKDKTGVILVECCEDKDFLYSEHGGKVRNVVDNR